MSDEQKPEQKPYRSSWRRKPKWPRLRIVDGQTVELLVVEDPLTFELAPEVEGQKPRKRHVVNVVVRDALNSPAARVCLVWEISDTTFGDFNFDPTRHWSKVTRCGMGRQSTHYKIEAGAEITETEHELAQAKDRHNLDLVATETQARHERANRRDRKGNKLPV